MKRNDLLYQRKLRVRPSKKSEKAKHSEEYTEGDGEGVERKTKESEEGDFAWRDWVAPGRENKTWGERHT
jgi:hypothetical protein